MNSRKRVLHAIDHNQTDRPPIDLSSHRSSGISAIAYAKLRNFLGLPQKPIKIYDMVQQLAVVDDDVLNLFGVDVIELGRGFLTEEKDWKDWVLPDETPAKIPYYINMQKEGENWYILSNEGIKLGVQKKNCLYFEQCYFPFQGQNIKADIADIEKKMVQNLWSGVPHPGAHLPLDETGLKKMQEKAKKLRESTNKAIVGLFGGNMFELPQWLFKMDNYLTYMGLYPKAVKDFSEKLCQIHLKNLEKWLSAVGDYIDIVCFGDDLGGQNGPLMSPEMYRKYYKPFHSKLWNKAKEISNVKVMLHCCGSITAFLDDLTDAGLDIINPVQISAADMDSKTLKNKFGDKIVFWGGGADTHNVLSNSDPNIIKKHVKQQVKTFNRNGGFVFQQVHNIMANVPPENIIAMYKAVLNP